MFEATINKRVLWPLLRERNVLREILALHLWQQLPLQQRQADDKTVLRTIAGNVRSLESGHDEKNQQPDQKSLTTAQRLQTIRQQLETGDPHSSLSSTELRGLRKQRKQLRQQMIADTHLVQFPMRQLSHMIPLITVFFFLSGYFIVSSILLHFNLNASRFFTLWDYVSSSMNAFRSLFSSLLIVAGILLLTFKRAKLSELQRLVGIRRLRDAIKLAVLLIIYSLAAYAYWRSWRILNLFLTISVLYSLAVFFPILATRFKQPLKTMFVLSFISVHSFFVYLTVQSSIDYYQQPFGSHETFFRIQLADSPATELRYRIITGNSLWLFVQDEKLDAHVIPVQQIKIIDIHKPAEKIGQ